MGPFTTTNSNTRRQRLGSILSFAAAVLSAGGGSADASTLPELVERMRRGEPLPEESLWLDHRPAEMAAAAREAGEALVSQRRLQQQQGGEAARPVTPNFVEPCFFEGDGCASCWIDRYYQIAQWDCPDFCGNGRDFVGHVDSDYDATQGRYVSREATCELLLCVPIGRGRCDDFEGNSLLPSPDQVPRETWTCQEQCFPETLTKAPASIDPYGKDGFLPPKILAAIIIATVGGAAIAAILLIRQNRSHNDEKVELIPATRRREPQDTNSEEALGEDSSGSRQTWEEVPHPNDEVEEEEEDETIQVC